MTKTPARINMRAEGGCSIWQPETEDVVYVTADGLLIVDLPLIKSVGIKNLTEVVEHHITTIMNSYSHMVRFTNGGVLKFAYNNVGQLIKLSVRDLEVNIFRGEEILVFIAE